MNTPGRSAGFQVVLALLIVTLSPLALLGSQTRQVTTVWNAKYIAGSEPISLTPRRKHFVVYLRRGTKLKVELGKDEITFQRKKKVLLSIPVAEVAQISYDHKSHRLSKKALKGMSDSGIANNCGLGCAFVAMVFVGTGLATLPFKYTDYFVQILWRENNTFHAIEVQLGREDCQAFLNAVPKIANVQAGQGPPIPKGSKVYVAPMGGFETYLERAFSKEKVPLEIVSDKGQADFVISGNSESQRPPLAFLFRSNEDASIIVTNLKTGKVVYSDVVQLPGTVRFPTNNKENSAHGKQSTAEACAKHLKERIGP